MTTTQSEKSLPLPPGNLGLPLLGETLDFFRDPDFQTKRRKKYGDIFKTHIFGRPTVVMTGAEANQFLFRNENKYVRSTWPKSTRTLLGSNSLAVQSGNIHTSRRKLLFQAFQPRALASYISTIEKITDSYLENWEKQGNITWYPKLRDYTFDVAGTIFVGRENVSETPLRILFEQWSQGLFSLPINLPWTRFGKSLRCRQQILNYLEEIIKSRQKQTDLGKDALGVLLQAKDEEENSFSIAELKDQILALLFGGHETLTSSVTSFCLLMAQHPEVMEKVRQEQEKFDTSAPLTMEELQQMPYLDQVLKEVLRFISPVGGGFREVIAPCEFKGYRIPQGWAVQYQIINTHKDRSIYQDHQKFDPDRFAPGREEDKKKMFGYIPFGGGMRECIGKEFARLEMKILAAKLARNYQWELLPDQDLSLITFPVPRPRDDLKVKFSRC